MTWWLDALQRPGAKRPKLLHRLFILAGEALVRFVAAMAALAVVLLGGVVGMTTTPTATPKMRAIAVTSMMPPKAKMPPGLGLVLGAGCWALAHCAVPSVAMAAESTVAEIPASGLLFKDTIKVDRFDDPKVEGVSIYLADYQRPINERLAKDFFSDPTQASVTCVATGPLKVSDSASKSKEGEEVFSQSRNLFFKAVKVRRIIDEEAKAVVYVSYSVRLSKDDDSNKSRFKSSLCALPMTRDTVSSSSSSRS